jgi:hypothetical protein
MDESPQIPLATTGSGSGDKTTGLTGSNALVSGAPWMVRVLPYIEQETMFNQFDHTAPFMTFGTQYPVGTRNMNAAKQRNLRFECPSDPNSNEANFNSNYFGVQGGCTPITNVLNLNAEGCITSPAAHGSLLSVNGALPINGRVSIDAIKDGTTNTILLAETKYMQIRTSVHTGFWYSWASGFNIAWDTTGSPTSADGWRYRYKVSLVALVDQPNIWVFNAATSAANANGGLYMNRYTGSFHSGGINVANCDGSVRFVSDSVSPTAFRSAGRISDGGPLGGIN